MPSLRLKTILALNILHSKPLLLLFQLTVKVLWQASIQKMMMSAHKRELLIFEKILDVSTFYGQGDNCSHKTC